MARRPSIAPRVSRARRADGSRPQDLLIEARCHEASGHAAPARLCAAPSPAPRIYGMGVRERPRPHYEDARFGALVSALEMVAADPGEQEPALPALRSVAEAIRRGEPVSTFGQAIAEGLELPPAVAERIARIDERFDRLVASTDLEAWRSRALLDDPLFDQMRCLAREALEDLGLPRRSPPRAPRAG